MNEKKNIDRLFQEKFKDFEAVPEQKVWDNIEAELNKKKKRRVIPLWLRLSGAAAILLIGFMIGDGMIRNSSEENIEIVNEDNSRKSNTENQILPMNNEETVANIDTERSSSKNDISNETQFNSDGDSKENSLQQNSLKNKIVVNQESNSKVKTTNSGNKNSKKNIISGSNKYNDDVIANNSNRKKSSSKKLQGIKNFSEIIIPDENTVAFYAKEKNTKNTEDKFGNQVIPNSQKDTKNINTSSIVFDTEAFEKQKKDSTVVAAVEPNALEELLKEKEKQPVTEAKLNRWQITSNVAPIYFSSASNGSPIDAEFADNNKNYENNLSYGIGVNYALNKKWSVKGGVNKLTLGYNTNDIVYYASLGQSARGISTSSYSARGSSIIIEDNVVTNILSFDNIQNKTPGHINQKMGYIEVPVEVSYKLLDRKFGIEIVGGMSTMFLNENSLSVVSNGMQASIGKAENLNDVSFTSNIGLGFKYKFWKSFEANIEPKFKYQLNTFSENAGGFKPYFIGLYSGINFNF